MTPDVSIHVGDCVPWLATLPPGGVDLVFADPPFNIGYRYDGYDDGRRPADYLAWCDAWLAGCVRALSPVGSMFVAIGDSHVADLKLRLDALGLTLRNWIVWRYRFGVYCAGKFGRDHTHILYYAADPRRRTFDADAVRVPSRRQAIGDRRADPRGRVPGDVWDFPRVCGTFRERAGRPCQMPEAVLERIVRVASRPGDLVADPFVGSGTTAAVCARLGRRFEGAELNAAYAAAARGRVAAIRDAE